MAIFLSQLMCALTISALLSVSSTSAVSPSPAPAMAMAPTKSKPTATPPAMAMPPATMSPSTGMAPSTSPDCMTQLYNMSDCLSYVEQGSKTKKPDANCCPELAGLLDSNPICLCSFLSPNASASLPIQLDVNRALKLPTVCGLQTPPVSMCSVLGIPVAAPSGSASSGMGMGPGPMVAGATAGPSAGENGNGVSNSNSYCNLSLLISALAIAFFTH